MGSGKSSVGREVARELSLSFIDLDCEIERREGMSISRLVDSKGEVYFRRVESMIFNELMDLPESFVLALGGGTPCYANNHLRLKEEGVISVFLSATVRTLVSRLEVEKSVRPLIADVDNLVEFVGPHLLERGYFYSFAHHRVVVDGRSVSEVCAEVIGLSGG